MCSCNFGFGDHVYLAVRREQWHTSLLVATSIRLAVPAVLYLSALDLLARLTYLLYWPIKALLRSIKSQHSPTWFKQRTQECKLVRWCWLRIPPRLKNRVVAFDLAAYLVTTQRSEAYMRVLYRASAPGISICTHRKYTCRRRHLQAVTRA